MCSRIFRTGVHVQMRVLVEAMRCMRDFREIRVWCRTPEKAAVFAKKHGCVAMSAEDAPM